MNCFIFLKCGYLTYVQVSYHEVIDVCSLVEDISGGSQFVQNFVAVE